MSLLNPLKVVLATQTGEERTHLFFIDVHDLNYVFLLGLSDLHVLSNLNNVHLILLPYFQFGNMFCV
jgi:hypothetical protein